VNRASSYAEVLDESARGLDNHPDSGVETEHGPHLRNYVIVHKWAVATSNTSHLNY
jgi:hypothetical protein